MGNRPAGTGVEKGVGSHAAAEPTAAPAISNERPRPASFEVFFERSWPGAVRLVADAVAALPFRQRAVMLASALAASRRPGKT
ncbi:MAG: hypothetical protein ACRD0S_04930 [Acidimicrobiales bacterium]